ncbi:unnamed protein product [Cyprideis torosa]|uniref:Uncharacterized protein n=1 Tax=Cyprideis torosa TaxID=163714 RepID=A0A7R8ZUY8_9CRUS|nr:unnamed protein product [Cyprideis torosa]CAG0909593.1 unnamed protein product [Cyprideis torosa]
MGKKNLIDHFHQTEWPYAIATPGEDVSIGKRTLSFLETPMLHWPDSMFTYIKEDRLLFSSDAFGQHLATSERFDDEVDQSILREEMTKYYANILTLFSPRVKKLLETVTNLGLQIDMIAPDHGVLWRKDPAFPLTHYDRWANNRSLAKALVIYDTMWGSTEKMANAVAMGLDEEKISYTMHNLRHNHISDVMRDVLDASAIVLGCPTLNNGLLPRMASFIMYMKGLRPAEKIGAAFGSYGWSGESVKMLSEVMESLDFDLLPAGIRTKYLPEDEDLQQCRELGRMIGQKVKQGK